MRTGSGFVDDDGYLNASAKKTAALENAEVIAVRKRFPDPKNCAELEGTMQAIDAYIESIDKARLTARGAAQKNQANAQSKAAGIRRSELVRISSILGCNVQRAEAEAAAQAAELREVTESVKAVKGAGGSRTMDYVIYGVVGIAVLGVIYLVARRA